MSTEMSAAIHRYLATGDCDPRFAAWPGRTIFERAQNGHDALIGALVAEVENRHSGQAQVTAFPEEDLGTLRAKLEPMVRGLFPRREQEAVLRLLERSVVFMMPSNIAAILGGQRWLDTAWSLANLYLRSIGAELLSPDAPLIVGLSAEATCYVSAEYFTREGRFADFVMHEAAHVFHNCKRGTVGFPETRSREWLLDIEFRKRETFAYACEVYSRLLELAGLREDRLSLLQELEAEGLPGDASVSQEELAAILRSAVEARNGWSTILAACSPAEKGRRVRAVETVASPVAGRLP
jgi:hypothetical protein